MRAEALQIWAEPCVYMVVFGDLTGPVFVKVGISDSIWNRYASIKRAAPAKPRLLAFMPCRSREFATRLENALIAAFAQWAYRGREWFSMPIEHKPIFNAAWKTVFAENADQSDAMQWQIVDLAKMKRRR